MAEQFEKDTGIEVEYISLGGGDAVARVQAEMSNPQADFLVGGSVDLYGSLAEAGALLEYDSPTTMTWMRASMTPIISGRAGTWAF